MQCLLCLNFLDRLHVSFLATLPSGQTTPPITATSGGPQTTVQLENAAWNDTKADVVVLLDVSTATNLAIVQDIVLYPP